MPISRQGRISEASLDVTEGKLEVTEAKLEVTAAALETTKAELSDEQQEREALAKAFRKTARSVTSSSTGFSTLKVSFRLLPTNWGAALSC